MPDIVTENDAVPNTERQEAPPNTQRTERRISETTTAVDDSSSNAAAKLARFKKHPIGFHVLYQPTDSCGVIADVVFVHGLAGGAIDTWTCEEPRALREKLRPWAHPSIKTCWPLEILPKEQADIRILTYGYSAPIARNPFFSNKVVSNNLDSDAETFLTQLISFRNKTHTEYRPLIFIGHSLGGLIIERALARCSQLDEHYPDQQRIFSCTRAVTAIGVPHRGSPQATRALRIAWLVWPFLGLNTGVLRTLKVQTSKAFDWREDYITAVGERYNLEKPILLTYLAEKFGYTYIGKIVDQASAVLTTQYQAISSEIEGNHLTMVKPSSADDPQFSSIWDPLRRLIECIKNGTEWIIWNEDNYYRWDSFPGTMMAPGRFIGRQALLADMEMALKSKDENSIRGKDDPRVIALVGLGGVGKSQLALQYAHQAQLKLDSKFSNVFLFDSSSKDSLESGIRAACDLVRKNREKIDSAWTPTDAVEEDFKARFVRDYFRKTRRKWLVILDNYDAVETYDIQQVMPKGRTGCIIITSRATNPDCFGMPPVIEVPPLETKNAVTLLRDRLYRFPTQSYQRPWVQADAIQLVERLGNLPLAIEMAAAYITTSHKNTSLAEFLKAFKRREKSIFSESMRSLPYRKVKSQKGREVSLSIMATFDIQIERLKEQQKGKAWKYLEIAGFLSRNRIDAPFFDRTQTALSCTDHDEWINSSPQADIINDALNELAGNSLATLMPTKKTASGSAAPAEESSEKTPVPQLRLHAAISEWIRMRQATLEDGQKVFRKAARMINFHLRRCDHDDLMSCNYGLTSTIAQHIRELIQNDEVFNTGNTDTDSPPPNLENRLGAGNLLAATIRFAGFMQDMGHPANAETLYNLATNRTTLEDADEPTKLHLTDAKEGLAIINLWKGELDEAHKLCKECREANEKSALRGEKHRTTLRTYHNLGEILCARKEFSKAIEMFEKARTAAFELDKEDGLGLVDKVGNKLQWSEDSLREQEALGNAYRCNGELALAHKTVIQALEYLKKNKADSDLCYSTHESLALVLKAQKDFGGSLELYKIAIDGYRKTVGESQHGTLGALEGQADAMRRNGEFTKARQELQRILELRRQVNGQDSEHFKRVARALKLVPKDKPGEVGPFIELEEYSFPWPRPVYAADDPAEDAADKDDDWT